MATVSGLANTVVLKSQLQRQIWMAMDGLGRGRWGDGDMGRGGGFVGDCDSNRKMTWQGIPLRRLSDEMGIVYRSAIALKLSSLWQQSAIDIADQLMAALPGVSQDSVELLGLEFWVEVASPGWINFRLSDRALATWLQQLIQIPSFVAIPGNYLLGGGDGEMGRWGDEDVLDDVFLLQYVHARCCSLLRLGHSQGLIEVAQRMGSGVENTDFSGIDCNWQIIKPNPIPWLNNDQLQTTNNNLPPHPPLSLSPPLPLPPSPPLQLQHPAEQALIAQMVDLLDGIGDRNHENWLKRGIALSERFEQFYSSCRIWGEVKTQTPKLAQARLGLVGVTQALMRSLLQEQFGIFPRVEV